MATKFKKGDIVTRIRSWDDKGTFYVQDFVVSSWGKVQATLVSIDGNNLKEQIYTAYVNREDEPSCAHLIVKTADGNAEALAMQFAVRFVAMEIAAHERLLLINANEGAAYLACRHRDIAALKAATPAVIRRGVSA